MKKPPANKQSKTPASRISSSSHAGFLVDCPNCAQRGRFYPNDRLVFCPRCAAPLLTLDSSVRLAWGKIIRSNAPYFLGVAAAYLAIAFDGREPRNFHQFLAAFPYSLLVHLVLWPIFDLVYGTRVRSPYEGRNSMLALLLVHLCQGRLAEHSLLARIYLYIFGTIACMAILVAIYSSLALTFA
ncbi:MAG: hypothetical protein K8S54_08925 [Spirochaetia bacterium]|nr:hypothetical protein [Spirochaetia bacterium]